MDGVARGLGNLAEGLLRLHGAGVELAELGFSSDDTGTFTPYNASCSICYMYPGGVIHDLTAACSLLLSALAVLAACTCSSTHTLHTGLFIFSAD